MKNSLIDRDCIDTKEIGGNYNQFFCILFLETIYKNSVNWNVTNCNDIAVKSSVSRYGIWTIHIINYFDENIQERVDKFLNLFRVLQPLSKLPEPTVEIINDNNIKIECNEKEYNDSAKKLFLLKIFRFSYLYFGETIGQLFLNQRNYLMQPTGETFTMSSDSQHITLNPNAWFYSLLNFEKASDTDFLNSRTLMQIYKDNEIHLRIRDITK